MSLDGEGYYQEKGSEKRILRKGDVVKCPANTPHWHGASAEKPFIQIAITSRVDGPTEWLHPVTEEQYLNGMWMYGGSKAGDKMMERINKKYGDDLFEQYLKDYTYFQTNIMAYYIQLEEYVNQSSEEDDW